MRVGAVGGGASATIKKTDRSAEVYESLGDARGNSGGDSQAKPDRGLTRWGSTPHVLSTRRSGIGSNTRTGNRHHMHLAYSLPFSLSG